MTPLALTPGERRVLLTADRTDPYQRLGVLNPAVARDHTGTPYLFPRIATKENESRIARCELHYDEQDELLGVGPLEVVLEPDRSWERNPETGGVEDPRITRLEALDMWVLTYAAYGPLGPRIALAASSDLRDWERLGPVTFGYEPGLGVDLNLYTNKDAVFFPEPVTAPDGRLAVAMLHRPTWDLSWLRPGAGAPMPVQLADPRPGIWVSYVPLDGLHDTRLLTHQTQHQLVALAGNGWESEKIGAGPPPIRFGDNWLLIYHGVEGDSSAAWPQTGVRYCAGWLLLDGDDVSKVAYRHPDPLLAPELAAEREGVVGNVVFPTAVDITPRGRAYLFYGAADAAIGVVELTGLV